MVLADNEWFTKVVFRGRVAPLTFGLDPNPGQKCRVQSMSQLVTMATYLVCPRPTPAVFLAELGTGLGSIWQS